MCVGHTFFVLFFTMTEAGDVTGLVNSHWLVPLSIGTCGGEVVLLVTVLLLGAGVTGICNNHGLASLAIRTCGAGAEAVLFLGAGITGLGNNHWLTSLVIWACGAKVALLLGVGVTGLGNNHGLSPVVLRPCGAAAALLLVTGAAQGRAGGLNRRISATNESAAMADVADAVTAVVAASVTTSTATAPSTGVGDVTALMSTVPCNLVSSVSTLMLISSNLFSSETTWSLSLLFSSFPLIIFLFIFVISVEKSAAWMINATSSSPLVILQCWSFPFARTADAVASGVLTAADVTADANAVAAVPGVVATTTAAAAGGGVAVIVGVVLTSGRGEGNMAVGSSPASDPVPGVGAALGSNAYGASVRICSITVFLLHFLEFILLISLCGGVPLVISSNSPLIFLRGVTVLLFSTLDMMDLRSDPVPNTIGIFFMNKSISLDSPSRVFSVFLIFMIICSAIVLGL